MSEVGISLVGAGHTLPITAADRADPSGGHSGAVKAGADQRAPAPAVTRVDDDLDALSRAQQALQEAYRIHTGRRLEPASQGQGVLLDLDPKGLAKTVINALAALGRAEAAREAAARPPKSDLRSERPEQAAQPALAEPPNPPDRAAPDPALTDTPVLREALDTALETIRGGHDLPAPDDTAAAAEQAAPAGDTGGGLPVDLRL